jgi:hypothetical protein
VLHPIHPAGFGDFAPTVMRDWASSYFLIVVSLVLMTNFVVSLCAVFHVHEVDADTVNLDHERSNEKLGLCVVMYREYMRNWKLQLTVLWCATVVYTFIGGAIFRQVQSTLVQSTLVSVQIRAPRDYQHYQ